MARYRPPAERIVIGLLFVGTLMMAGCGQFTPTTATAPPKGMQSTAEVEVMGDPSKTRAFYETLMRDCLTLSDEPTYRKLPRETVEAAAQGYCACFVNEFRERFTAEQVETYLSTNQTIQENDLDVIADSCEVHLSDIADAVDTDDSDE